MASESELERLKEGISHLNATVDESNGTQSDAAAGTPQTLAAEKSKYLGETGLTELITMLAEKFLKLTGGTLTGDLKVGGTTIQASGGHIILPSGVEIY